MEIGSQQLSHEIALELIPSVSRFDSKENQAHMSSKGEMKTSLRLMIYEQASELARYFDGLPLRDDKPQNTAKKATYVLVCDVLE